MEEESGGLKRNSKPLIVKIVLVLVPVVRKLLEFINRGAVLFLLTCKRGGLESASDLDGYLLAAL